VAEELAETRHYPMLIVRRKPRRPYGSVVLALDGSAASAGAVRCVESIGIVASVPRYTVLHAFEPPYLSAFYVGAGMSSVDAHIAGWRREHRRAIADVLATESESPSRYDIVLEEGRAAVAILNYVRRHTPDLLIMGTRGGGRIHRAFLGSVAREVAQRVRCDVLLIPQQARSIRAEQAQGIKASRVA
jgi:nucleotide-binding universal stress UspA family protein